MTDTSHILDYILQQLTYNPAEPLIFSSGLFLWLFLGFVAVYALMGRTTTLRLLFVTLFSYYFYYKSSGIYFYLLAVVTVSDFLIAKAIHSSHDRRWLSRLWLTLSIVLDLSLLAYFKYTNFFAQTIADIMGSNFQPLDIFLPVGISFFTFQSLSYTIDVYRRQITPLTNLLDYAFYVSFFPQLVAGPIVRARDFLPQIRRPLNITSQMVGTGVFYIIGGLLKKAVISDYISINFVERVFDAPALYSGFENMMAVYGYAMQIYCDFSGYSDMAIGIALLLGFRFPQNFNAPYKATSISDFWRRWHISLSSWLKDYLYISLGGNRHGQFRQYLNLMITMLLGGLWHGASINFILWGGLHGIMLCIDKMWHRICPILSPLDAKTPAKQQANTPWRKMLKVVSAIITFHIVCTAWVFFRSSSFDSAFAMLNQIFTHFQPQVVMQWLEGYKLVAIFIATGFIMHFMPGRWANATRLTFSRMPLVVLALLMVCAIYLVVQVKSSDVQPFIYFQF